MATAAMAPPSIIRSRAQPYRKPTKRVERVSQIRVVPARLGEEGAQLRKRECTRERDQLHRQSRPPGPDPGVGRRSATMYGLMKIPAPMIPPTTTMVASNGPNALLKTAGFLGRIIHAIRVLPARPSFRWRRTPHQTVGAVQNGAPCGARSATPSA